MREREGARGERRLREHEKERRRMIERSREIPEGERMRKREGETL